MGAARRDVRFLPDRVLVILVHDAVAGALQLRHQLLQPDDLEGEVVNPFAALAQEAREEAVLAERLQQLDLRAVRVAVLLEPEAALARVAPEQEHAAEDVAIEPGRSGDAVHRVRRVIELHFVPLELLRIDQAVSSTMGSIRATRPGSRPSCAGVLQRTFSPAYRSAARSFRRRRECAPRRN